MVAATGTPSWSVALAQKLLAYDPTQRLVAADALHHSFFEGVHDIMQGRAVPQMLDANEDWARVLRKLFETCFYLPERVPDLLPRFEVSVQRLADTGTWVPLPRAILNEVSLVIEHFYDAEVSNVGALKGKALVSLRQPRASDGVGQDLSTRKRESSQLSTSLQTGDGIAAMLHQARMERDANESLRSQLAQMLDTGSQIFGQATGSDEEPQYCGSGLGRRAIPPVVHPASSDNYGVLPGAKSSPSHARASLIDTVPGVNENKQQSGTHCQVMDSQHE